jgi:hypothetical protein
MKIPESVRIGGVDYKIEFVPDLNDGECVIYGHIHYGESKIKINSTNQEHQHKCVALWHEILHGLIEHANLRIDDEEQIVNVLAKGIYQVLQDNAKKFFDIKEGDIIEGS